MQSLPSAIFIWNAKLHVNDIALRKTEVGFEVRLMNRTLISTFLRDFILILELFAYPSKSLSHFLNHCAYITFRAVLNQKKVR